MSVPEHLQTFRPTAGLDGVRPNRVERQYEDRGSTAQTLGGVESDIRPGIAADRERLTAAGVGAVDQRRRTPEKLS